MKLTFWSDSDSILPYERLGRSMILDELGVSIELYEKVLAIVIYSVEGLETVDNPNCDSVSRDAL